MNSHYHNRTNHNNRRNQLLQTHFENIQNLTDLIRESQRLLQPYPQQQQQQQTRRFPIYEQFNNNPYVYSFHLDRGIFQNARNNNSYITHHVDGSNTTIPENANVLIYDEFRFIDNPINEICPITRESFFQNQTVSMIKSCRHIFNKDALQIWLSNNHTCPTCRANITSSSSLNID